MGFVVNTQCAVSRDGRYLMIVRGQGVKQAPDVLAFPGGKVEIGDGPVSVGAVIDGLVCALIGGVPGTVPGRRRGDGNGSVRLIGESVAGSGLDENALAA